MFKAAHLIAVCALIAAVAQSPTTFADAGTAPRIEPQPLAGALDEWAKRYGVQLIYGEELTNGSRSAGAIAGATREAALIQILAGSGLTFKWLNERTVSIRRSATIETAAVLGAAEDRMEVAQVQQTHTAQQDQEENKAQETAKPVEQEVVVTGSRILGVGDQFAPVTRFARSDIDAAGVSNVVELLSTLPQNFGGNVPSPDSSGGSSAGAGAATVNLRGIGQEGTLTLLNGRRLSLGGSFGDFVDISTIPTSAIERVEVLNDGASAIYGSDAVAGVVNIILNKDFSGAETRARVGTVTDGGSLRLSIGQSFGVASERGRALVSYEYSDEERLDSNDKDFSRSAIDPRDLLPASRKHGVFASGAVEFGDGLEVYSDLFFNKRRSTQSVSGLVAIQFEEAKVEQFGGTAGLAVAFKNNWLAEASLSRSQNDSSAHVIAPAQSFQGFEEGASSVVSADASVSGSLLTLAGGDARLLIGSQARWERYDGFRHSLFSTVEQVALDVKDERRVTAAFGEFYLPIFTEKNRRTGFERLALTVAGRYEEYADIGSSVNPKIGLAWSPLSGLTLRSTRGTSFRAPTLQQSQESIDFVQLVDYVDPDVPAGQSVALVVGGSRADIDPEESTNMTFGFDLQPVLVPQLQLRFTYFDIDYEKRIAQPFPSVDLTTFRYFGYPLLPQRNVDPAFVNALISQAPIFINVTPFSGSNSLPQDTEILIDSRPVNMAATQVRGYDVSAKYLIDSAIGQWNFSVDVSKINLFREQFTPLRQAVDVVDTITHPADLRLRGGASFAAAHLLTSVFVNYTDDYLDDQAIGQPKKVASWTTLDATARYDFKGTLMTLSIRNLLNKDPPAVGLTSVTAQRQFLYDPANADPEGRVISLLLTRHW